MLIRIEDAKGQALEDSCIYHDGGRSRHPYGPLMPGESFAFLHPISCFAFSAVRPGILTIKATYRPRNDACDPGGRFDAKCFEGEVEMAATRVRYEGGRLFRL